MLFVSSLALSFEISRSIEPYFEFSSRRDCMWCIYTRTPRIYAPYIRLNGHFLFHFQYVVILSDGGLTPRSLCSYKGTPLLHERSTL